MRRITNQIRLSAQETELWKQYFESLHTPIEEVLFLDIETTGFNRTYDSIYLVGVLYYREGHFYLEQLLAQSLRDETAVLESAISFLDDYAVVLTFNGDMFDHPFMKQRFEALHLSGDYPEYSSVDLYRRFRAMAKVFGWSNCKLKTIEVELGIDRDDEFSGGELIDVFYEYAKSNDPGLEKQLLLHNYEDIENMPRLLKMDHYAKQLTENRIESVSLDRSYTESVRLRVVYEQIFELTQRGVLLFDKKCASEIVFQTEAGSPVLFLTLPLCQGIRYYYLPNPGDYHYYPLADSILHKSLEGTVDLGPHKQATAKNCRIPKDGTFLMHRESLPGLHVFKEEGKSKALYYEIEEFTEKLKTAEKPFAEALVGSLLKW